MPGVCRLLSPKSARDRVEKPVRSGRSIRRKGSAFNAIAKGFEFLDHANGAGALGFGSDRGSSFLVADPFMQNLPEQPAEPMGDGPNGLLVSQARQQAAKGD